MRAKNTNLRPITTNQYNRIFSPEECNSISSRALSFISRGGELDMSILSTWIGNIRWARNEIISSSDTRQNRIVLTRSIRGASARTRISSISEASLKRAIERCERYLQGYNERASIIAVPRLDPEEVPIPTVWYDSTFNLMEEERADIYRSLSAIAEKEGMVSAGYIEVSGNAQHIRSKNATFNYGRFTDSRISITVRAPDGTASGWAGVSWDNWARVDGDRIAEIALEKCLKSRGPIAIEPGRYTVVLEAQAVHDLVHPLFSHRTLSRSSTEHPMGGTFYTLKTGYSKIGLRIFDPRINVRIDPYHPDASFYPYAHDGSVSNKVTWIEEGVLKDLSYSREYAIATLGVNEGKHGGDSYIMDGGGVEIETMISNTERGLLVTRFDIQFIYSPLTMLTSGLTRDGLWLIENGRISKPVKNMRFTESPAYMLNNVLELGVPQRVFSPGMPVLVPPIRAQDFSFTATIDAI